MPRIVIFGAGDIARLAHFYFSRDSPHEVVAFAVDPEYRAEEEFDGLPLVDAAAAVEKYPPGEFKMFVALSYARMNKARAAKYQWAKEAGYELVSYISSRCTYLSERQPGDNCFILEDNTIQPFVQIGNNVTMWSGNHIGHDSVIEDHCFITSHTVVSGHVRVGAYTFIGVNATLRNSITVAPETLIGAGAIVMRDTEPKSVHVPRPSQQLSKTSDEMDL
jgi:sugar O-acyltransferase (sialic acid O-acetyltransferase NeuD family)